MKTLIFTTALGAAFTFNAKSLKADYCKNNNTKVELQCQVGGAYNIAKLKIFSHCSNYAADINYEGIFRGEERVFVTRNSNKDYRIEDRLVVYKNSEGKWRINDILSYANADEPREIYCE